MTEVEMHIAMIVAAGLFLGACAPSYTERAEAACTERGLALGTETHAECVEAEIQKQRLVMGL